MRLLFVQIPIWVEFFCSKKFPFSFFQVAAASAKSAQSAESARRRAEFGTATFVLLPQLCFGVRLDLTCLGDYRFESRLGFKVSRDYTLQCCYL
jgi:hypothetical protein